VSWCWWGTGPFIGHTPSINLNIVDYPTPAPGLGPAAEFFLAARRRKNQRNAPRLAGPAGFPSSAHSTRPVAKLATLKQRDWNSRVECAELGGLEGKRVVLNVLYIKTRFAYAKADMISA